MNKKELFNFMLNQIDQKIEETKLRNYKAFPLWFLDLYFEKYQDFISSDGSNDGKVDAIFKTVVGSEITNYALNSKFTKNFERKTNSNIYNEINSFCQNFIEKEFRENYLKKVKKELRPKYRELFNAFDRGQTKLIFLTNLKKDEKCSANLIKNLPKNFPLELYHLDDLIQYLLDDIDHAMPRTPQLTFSEIHNVLKPDPKDSGISTSIVFARLIDLIKYMEKDPNGLLFARNVRISLGNTGVNKEIKNTFENQPEEFSYSSNGITILCEKQIHNGTLMNLNLENPRVVNGAQTLHSIREVENPDLEARVMVRIIEIPPIPVENLKGERNRRKEIIEKISIRSNQQNPIKPFDLVSQDDFQIEIFRFFRTKKYFYERRRKEWSSKSRALQSCGFQRGPDIKSLMKLIASYNWDKKHLGPAIAKSSVSSLFSCSGEDSPYRRIRNTSQELTFQVFLFNKIINYIHTELAKRNKEISHWKGYSELILFSMMVKTFRQAGANWDRVDFTSFLEREIKNFKSSLNYNMYKKIIRGHIDEIHKKFKKEKIIRKRKEGQELTFANYVKSNSVLDLLETRIPNNYIKLASKILKI
jgi:hypothetical protein